MEKIFKKKGIKFILLFSVIVFTNFQLVLSQSYCTASGGCDEYIQNVKIGTIDNTSECDEYHDYTSLSTDLNIGCYYPIEITIGDYFSNDDIGCWIDWNNDKDFEDSGESITIPSSSTGTATINVPASAVVGITRMRVRVVYSTPLSPCGTSTYGEVEDYTINITNNTEPEIQVKNGSTDINVSDTLNISGYTSIGSYEDITFTVYNMGNIDLTIGTVSENSDQYSILQQPDFVLVPNSSTEFILRFQPTSDGEKITTIQFNNNDNDENPFNFKVAMKGGEQTPVDWTFMVYLLEDGTGLNGAEDINEWEVNGSVDGQVNYIVLYDAQNDVNDGIYYVEKDPGGDNGTIVSQIVSTVLGTDPNMDDWHTLKDFMIWTNNNYPAEHYGISLWDHGSGIFKNQQNKNITKGCVGDMKLWQLDNALEEFTASIGRKVDIVGFDVCLLGQIETAYQLKDYSDYVIASEKTEPGDGWDYDNSFTELNSNPGISASQLATNIVEAYIDSYSSSVTQAATSTAALESYLIPAVNAFSDSLISYLYDYKTQIKSARDNAWNSSYNADHKDLGDFALNITNSTSLPDGLKTAAQSVLNAIDTAVIAEGHIGNDGATGLKVWMTETFENEGSLKTLYLDSLIFSQTKWDEYLINYQNPQSPVPVGGTAHTNNNPICSGNSTTITLSDYNGNIQWQQSLTYDGTYVNVTGGSGANSDIYTTPELIETTFYRAALSHSGYTTVYSTIDSVNVLPMPEPGTATAETDIFCSNGSTIITLDNFVGDIQWQQLSPTTDDTYVNVIDGTGANTDTYTTADLTTTKSFRAQVTNPQSGCLGFSNVVTLTINQLSVGGTAFTNDSIICEGNTSTISVSDYYGNIQWQQASNYDGAYSDISDAVNDTITTDELSATTYFRAVVTNGICENNTSNILPVIVNYIPIAEFSYNVVGSNTINFVDNSSYATSYLWKFGDGETDTVANPTHVYSNNDDFKVVQIVNNSCGQDSIEKNITFVGIDNINNDNYVNIYPNPNNGRFDLELNSNQYGKISIKIFNISGQEIYSKNINKNSNQLIENINLSYFKSGIYQLRIVSLNNVMNTKIIIK